MHRRYAHRTDSNQQQIIDALRLCGVVVHDTSPVGDGFPDLVCHRPASNSGLKLLEVKDADAGGRLTPDQERFALDWPVHVVHSVDEALAVFGIAT